MPFFSIIVPIYNVAPYLRECLDSVKAQSYANWECICVDDGSTDASSAILDEYAMEDRRFRVIHQSNAGEGEARNAGLSTMHGDWIVFLDGDDILASNALKHITSLSADADIDLVRFGYRTFEDGETASFDADESNGFADIDISRSIEMTDFFVLVPQHAFRRTVLEGLRFKAYRRGCDRVFMDDILLHRVDIIRVTAAVLYGYRQRSGSAMNSQPSIQVLLDEMDHRLDIIRMIDESGKSVRYSGDYWLEGYFTTEIPRLLSERKENRRAVASAWRRNLRRLRFAKGLSSYGRMFVRIIPYVYSDRLSILLCRRILPAIRTVKRFFHASSSPQSEPERAHG